MNLDYFKSWPRLKILTYLSFALLAVATCYGAWYANYYASSNSDNIVYPYLFQHFQLHDMVLPGQHANILKFPLFILQSILPYNFTTTTIVNIGLVLVTTLGWAGLLVWLFGRRYAGLICLALSSILLASTTFNLNVLGGTIRNIEFPIVLAFIICSGNLLKKTTLPKSKRIISYIVGVLFAMTAAGDSFFLYTICTALLATLAYYWLTSNQRTKLRQQYKSALIYIGGFSILALVIRAAIGIFGIANYYTASVFQPHILTLQHLGPSISTASAQVMNLFGANIFGRTVAPSNGLYFLNFAILLVCLAGIILMVHDGFRAVGRKELLKRVDLGRTFTLAAIGLTFVVTFVVYIASDLVVSTRADGVVVSGNQDRYITLLPLILLASGIYLLWRKYNKQYFLVVSGSVIIALSLLITLPATLRDHKQDASYRSGPIALAQVAKSNNVNVLATGYWYGASSHFWSGNKLEFASIANCNIPQPTFNTRLAWYKPDPTVKRSALAVTHSGPDAEYWVCTDEQLVEIYGKPTQKVLVKDDPNQTTLWIYKYDVRSKVKPLTY